MSDCDYPEFYNETRPVARKDHTCCECRRPIPKGTKYARCVGKWDGDILCETQHIACRDFAAEMNSKYGFDGECFIAFGNVNSDVANASDWAPATDVPIIKERWEKIRQGVAA